MKKSAVIIMSACLAFARVPLHSQETDYAPFVATSAGTLLLAAGLYAWLDSYTQKTLIQHEEALDELVERFEKTPFENFRAQADEKIKEVHRVGVTELSRVRQVLQEEQAKVRDEINKYETVLGDVRSFLGGLRDRSGHAFMEQLSSLKQSIQSALYLMQSRKERLEGEINRIQEDIDHLRSRSRVAKNSVSSLERDVAEAQNRARRV